jgi:glucokinase
MRSSPILGVDLGGTKTLVGLFDPQGRLQVSRRYASAEFATLLPLLERFLTEERAFLEAWGSPDMACLAVAGPVDSGQARLTHLPWRIDAREIGARLGLKAVLLVNDFVAAAAGVTGLTPDELRSIQPGVPVTGAPRLVIGAGTGLGCAVLLEPERGAIAVPGDAADRHPDRDDDLGRRPEPIAGPRARILAGEGGHVGFAPRTVLEGRLWHWLHVRHGYVSVETVVSGPGIARIHAFLRDERGFGPADRRPESIDPTIAIAKAGLAPDDPDVLAAEALDLFAAAFGAVAGDMALASLTRGGVCLAGGIAPKVFDARRTAAFLRAFNAKGAHAPLMSSIPVSVVQAEDLGLRGTAALALGAARLS